MEEIAKIEESSQTVETLNDLPVAADQADDTKGGDTFSLNFQKVSFKYMEQKPDGSLD